jgi:hypothetical protein
MYWTERAGLMLSLLLACAPVPVQASLLDQLVDAFIEMTDKTEYKEGGERPRGVIKWSIPIEFNVIGATSAEAIKDVEAHMHRLSQLSHLEITRRRGFVVKAKGEREAIDDVHVLSDGFEFATMQEDKLKPGPVMNALADKAGQQSRGWLGNFSILFGKRRLLARVFDDLHIDRVLRDQFIKGEILCYSRIIFLKDTRDPHLAVVLIPTDQDAALIRRCQVEETTQALGLVNDIPGSTLTLFDDRPERRRTELTVYDQIFLRVLYNPEVRLGMTGAELRSTARRLIEAELSKQH